MKRIYDGSILTVDGIDFLVHIDADPFTGPPWEEEDGHGPVSDWTVRDKRPGEMVLSGDCGYRRFYDFQEAVRIARRDGWTAAPYVWRTRGEQAAAAALADYQFLKRWCNNEWFYASVTVRPLDEYGDILPIFASLSGVEYDYEDTSYIGHIIEELAWQVISEHEYMFAAPLPRVEAVIEPDALLTIPDFATPTRAA